MNLQGIITCCGDQYVKVDMEKVHALKEYATQKDRSPF